MAERRRNIPLVIAIAAGACSATAKGAEAFSKLPANEQLPALGETGAVVVVLGLIVGGVVALANRGSRRELKELEEEVQQSRRDAGLPETDRDILRKWKEDTREKYNTDPKFRKNVNDIGGLGF